VCVVSQDNYYNSIEHQQKDSYGVENFDLLTSIDHVAFYQDLLQLLDGKRVERMEYTFSNEKVQPQKLIYHSAPIIIIEGIFVLHLVKVKALLDLKLFIHAKDTLKIIRRIKRDRLQRNYPMDDVLHRYEHHVTPAYEKYIHPYMEQADMVINNNQDFKMALRIIKGFLNDYLCK
ncbi:MAG: uridine kinase, partial [Bacteroidota bacterium]